MIKNAQKEHLLRAQGKWSLLFANDGKSSGTYCIMSTTLRKCCTAESKTIEYYTTSKQFVKVFLKRDTSFKKKLFCENGNGKQINA